MSMSLGILLTLFIYQDISDIYIIFAQNVSELDSDAATSPFPPLSGTLKDIERGYEIQLPDGWSGYNTYGWAMAGPGGLNKDNISGAPLSTDPRDAVILRVIPQEKSNYLYSYIFLKGTDATTLEDSIEKAPQQLGPSCSKADTDASYININGVNVKKIVASCPKGGSIIYDFANENNVISLRFEGEAALSEYNLPKIEKSIQSLKVSNPVDIKPIIDQIALEASK